MNNISCYETELSKPTLGIHHFAVKIGGVDIFGAWLIMCFLEQQLQTRVVAAYDQNEHAAYYYYRLIDR